MAQMRAHQEWAAIEFVRKSWPDGDVVFNRLSGNTHLVSPLAAQILDFLRQHPTNSTEIARYLAAQNSIAVADDLIISVEELLANLETLGLVEVSNQ